MKYHDARAAWERSYLQDAINATASMAAAAASVGLNRTHFHKLTRRHGLRSPRQQYNNRGNWSNV